MIEWKSFASSHPAWSDRVTLFFLLSIAMSQLCSVQNYERAYLGCAQHHELEIMTRPCIREWCPHNQPHITIVKPC